MIEKKNKFEKKPKDIFYNKREKNKLSWKNLTMRPEGEYEKIQNTSKEHFRKRW